MAASARATAAQMRAAGATKAQVASVLASAKAYDAQARSIQTAATRHERMQRVALDAGDAMVALGVATIAGGAAAAYGLKQAVDTAVEYDRQVRLTYTQVDKRFKPSLVELGEIGRRTGRDIGVAFEEIQPALFDVFSSTEANVKEAEVLLRAFSKAAVAGQTEIVTASRATIGIMNAFRVPIKDVNRILDIQFQLVQEGVGTYEEWAQRIGLVTPSAVRAGQSVESMAAALATATRLGISAARAGTAVARAYDAISNPKTINKLKALNVQVLDARGNFRPLVDIMEDWQKQLNKLPPSKRVASILDVLKGAGSTIEARRFLQGILLTKGGLELFQEVMKEFEGDVGAFERAYGTMADSTANKSEKLRNKWKLLQEAIGRALMPAFDRLITMIDRVLDQFNRLPQGTQKVIANVLLFGTAILLVGGFLLTLIGAVIIFGGAIAGVGAPLLLVTGLVGGLILGLGGLAAGFYLAYKNSEEFRGLVDQTKVSIQRLWDIVSGFALGLYEDFNTFVLPQLKELWRVVEEEVIPVFHATTKQISEELIPKVKEAADFLNGVFKGALKEIGEILQTQLIPAIQDLTDWWNKHRNEIMPVVKIVGDLVKIMLILLGVLGATGLLTAVSSAVGAFRMFSSQLKVTWDIISLGILWIRSLWSQLQTLIGWVQKAWKAWNDFKVSVVRAIRDAVSAMKSAFDIDLSAAGERIMQSLINGIKRKFGPLANVLGEAASIAKSFWPFSPAKRGPLAGKGSLYYSGQTLMQDLARGVGSQTVAVARQMHKAAHDVSQTSLQAGSTGTGYSGGVGFGNQQQDASTSVNESRNDVTVNVYTNEIDPRTTAAELGWELSGRLDH
jgi:TP901 family phage tail tape measure protein